jgi:TM2 domain-containing membrane protein YozV
MDLPDILPDLFPSRTLYCPYCGAKVIQGDNFCHNCRRTFLDPLVEYTKTQLKPSDIKLRKPWISAIFSFIGLGLGQFYNGETGKGLIITILFFLVPYLFYTNSHFITLLSMSVIWVVAVIDAYVSSKKINKFKKPFYGKSIFFWAEIIFIVLFAILIFSFVLVNKIDLVVYFESKFLVKENKVHVNFTQEDLEKGAIIKEQPYILRGKNRHVQFTLFQGVNDYLTINKPNYYDKNNELYWKELIHDEVQQKYLAGLVRQIKKETDTRDDQARIAISIAQQIYYDKNLDTRFKEYGYYYPYQTIFKDSGACADKSFLLAYILKELGYGVALLKFDLEKHVVVGIKAPAQYTYKNTGYAFVDPVCNCIIPTYDKQEYGEDPEDPMYLNSTPTVVIISDGVSFDSIGEEYQDAVVFDRLYQLAQKNDQKLSHDDYYYTWQPLSQKYGCAQVYPKNVCE